MKNENKLLTSDYISIGVFSLIYFVIAFVIGGIAQMTPATFPDRKRSVYDRRRCYGILDEITFYFDGLYL